MSTLPVYIGKTQISALRFVSFDNYEFVSFPYSYSENIFGHYVTKEEFVRQINNLLQRYFKEDVSSYEIKIRSYTNLQELAAEPMPGKSWVQVNDFAVAAPGVFNSYFPTGQKDNLTVDQINYFSNMAIYPSYQTADPIEQGWSDLLTSTLTSGVEADSKEVVFTGDRFLNFKQIPSHLTLLILDSFKSAGVHALWVDNDNKLPLIDLLGREVFSIGEDFSKLEGELLMLGSLLKAPGGVECLFEIDSGDPQFVTLKKDEIFIFSLEEGKTARISAKGPFGTVEGVIKGGFYGLIIDTREVPTLDPRFKAKYMKVLQNSVRIF